MTKLKLIIISAAVIIFFLLAANFFGWFNKSREKDEGIKYLIGVSLPNLTESRMIYVYNQIKNEVSKYPSAAVQFYDASNDDIKQKQDAENMLSQKVDLMLMYPNNGEFLLDTIGKVYDSGIPVIIMDNPMVSGRYSMFIYTDHYKMGRSAGDYVLDLLGEHGGSVTEIQDIAESNLFIDEKRGFEEALKGHANIELTSIAVSGESRSSSEEAMKRMVQKKDKTDIIFAYNDDMAIGAWSATVFDRDRAKFVGIGGLPVKNEGLEAVDNGILDATVIHPTGAIEAITYALKILNGEKVPKQLELPVTRITKSNVKQFLEKP